MSSSEKESIRLYLGENNIQTEYGYIIRTNARECMNQLNCIVTELIHLSNQLKSILEKSSTRTLFSCVYENSQYFLEFLNSQSFETIQRIQTDVLSAFDICKSYLSN